MMCVGLCGLYCCGDVQICLLVWLGGCFRVDVCWVYCVIWWFGFWLLVLLCCFFALYIVLMLGGGC